MLVHVPSPILAPRYRLAGRHEPRQLPSLRRGAGTCSSASAANMATFEEYPAPSEPEGAEHAHLADALQPDWELLDQHHWRQQFRDETGEDELEQYDQDSSDLVSSVYGEHPETIKARQSEIESLRDLVERNQYPSLPPPSDRFGSSQSGPSGRHLELIDNIGGSPTSRPTSPLGLGFEFGTRAPNMALAKVQAAPNSGLLVPSVSASKSVGYAPSEKRTDSATEIYAGAQRLTDFDQRKFGTQGHKQGRESPVQDYLASSTTALPATGGIAPVVDWVFRQFRPTLGMRTRSPAPRPGIGRTLPPPPPPTLRGPSSRPPIDPFPGWLLGRLGVIYLTTRQFAEFLDRQAEALKDRLDLRKCFENELKKKDPKEKIPDGYVAHHIVMVGFVGMTIIRLRLWYCGIDINDCNVNGVLLPQNEHVKNRKNEALHESLHTKSYAKAVSDIIWNAEDCDEIRQALKDIKDGLLRGDIPGG